MAVNPQPGLMKPNSWSPNQIAKRNKIVQAASRLMVREGVHACTARMISAECGFSTSSIHYYFKDIDEILDLAIRRVIGRFLRQVENEAALHDDPVQALWAAAHAYFERTSDSIRATDGSGFRHAPMVWFEFQARSLRTGDIQTARDLSSEATQLFVKWMSKIEAITDPVGRADALYCALLGGAIRDSLERQPAGQRVRQLFASLDLPIPEEEEEAGQRPAARRATRKAMAS